MKHDSKTFVVVNDSRHSVKTAIEKHFNTENVIVLTAENFPTFENEQELMKFVNGLFAKIPENPVLVLSGTIEVNFLLLAMLLRRDSEIHYATYDFAKKRYLLRHFNYLDLR